MDIATTVYEHVKLMPPVKAYQVLNFVQWLECRPSTPTDMITLSLQDWASLQETLYVLQNQSLMTQIACSIETYQKGTGYQPTQEQLDEGD